MCTKFYCSSVTARLQSDEFLVNDEENAETCGAGHFEECQQTDMALILPALSIDHSNDREGTKNNNPHLFDFRVETE
jgi:hypothetical protein